MTGAYYAIVNPMAGFGKCGKLVGPALDRLRKAGLPIEVAETRRAGHGIELAREAYRRGFRRFIAVGGDGTSYEIINGLFPPALEGERPQLGFLPLGTGNSFLRDFTDDGVEYATRALLEGRSRPCDVFRLVHRAGEIYFINILSLGFVANVCTLANRRFKRLGEAGYFLAVVLCLARFEQRAFPMRLNGSREVESHRTALVIFNNSKYTGGKMMLAPLADTNDGLIEIVRWSAGRFDFIYNFKHVYDGSHLSHPKLWRGSANRIDFEFNEMIDVMVDGEVMRLDCQSLEVLRSAIEVIV